MHLRTIYIIIFIQAGFNLISQPSTILPEDVDVEYKKLSAGIGYNQWVKPILSDKCFVCHGNDGVKRKAGLRLDKPEMAYAPLPQNPGKVAIYPKDLMKSELYHRIISTDPNYLMPEPESHLTLSAKDKAVLIKWIEEGGVYEPHWAFVAPVNKPHQLFRPIQMWSMQ
jgi:hypothetical protein